MELEVRFLEAAPVQPGNLALTCQETFDLFQLRQAQRRADVRHPIVVADYVVPVLTVRGQSLSFEMYSPRVQRLVVRGHHPSFPGGDRLVAIETVSGDVSKSAYVS